MEPDCPGCFNCRCLKAISEKKMRFTIEAYLLFWDSTIRVVASLIFTPEPICSGHIVNGFINFCRETMGDMAPMTLDLLGIRTSQDLQRMCEDLIKIDLMPAPDTGDTIGSIGDTNVDLLQTLREPALKS